MTVGHGIHCMTKKIGGKAIPLWEITNDHIAERMMIAGLVCQMQEEEPATPVTYTCWSD